jgi:hypothetical protein
MPSSAGAATARAFTAADPRSRIAQVHTRHPATFVRAARAGDRGRHRLLASPDVMQTAHELGLIYPLLACSIVLPFPKGGSLSSRS